MDKKAQVKIVNAKISIINGVHTQINEYNYVNRMSNSYNIEGSQVNPGNVHYHDVPHGTQIIPGNRMHSNDPFMVSAMQARPGTQVHTQVQRNGNCTTTHSVSFHPEEVTQMSNPTAQLFDKYFKDKFSDHFFDNGSQSSASNPSNVDSSNAFTNHHHGQNGQSYVNHNYPLDNNARNIDPVQRITSTLNNLTITPGLEHVSTFPNVNTAMTTTTTTRGASVSYSGGYQTINTPGNSYHNRNKYHRSEHYKYDKRGDVRV